MINYALILGAGALVLGSGIVGYLLGRYQTALVDKIRTLEEQARQVPEAPPEPAKPAVVAGAYQPPREMSTSIDTKHKAGIVETKTAERLDWENKQELERMIQGG